METLPEVEYAFAMTDLEIKSHNYYLISLSEKLKDSSKAIFLNESDKLIKAYLSKENEIEILNKKYLTEYQSAINAYDNDICLCGSDLKKATGIYGQYWDCINKSNSKKTHKNYMSYKENNYPKPKLYTSDIAKSYLSDIIRENGYKGKLNAKALLSFYLSKGMPDLKEKYLNKSSSDQINTYANVKSISDAFEKECLELLKPLYTFVKPQFHIKYKFKGGKPNQVAKLDILCSNKKEVVIYECKTNNHDMDQEQMLKYIALIKHINKTDRPVLFYYLIDNERNSDGFYIIDKRKMWLEKGIYYGYPKCCIDSFMNRNKDVIQTKVSFNTGFIPCIDCSKKLKKPRDIDLIIKNRKCQTIFPCGDSDYSELHQQNVPKYYLNTN